MEINSKNLSNSEKIKIIATYRGFNLTTLGQEYNRRFGTKYTQNTFARKLRSDAISFSEMEQLGEILGFKVEITLED